MFAIGYEGSSVVPDQYVAPFRTIGTAVHESSVVSYPDLPIVSRNGNDAPVCGHGMTALRFPISINAYNVEAQ